MVQQQPGPIVVARPIADLFVEATIMFADIANFTAWCSVQEPAQVFFLLESTYNSFDKIARKMKAFKVETIGYCYVAAAGLPKPRKDHAVAMARFAHKYLVTMSVVAHNLELTLGPETSNLRMRFGLHSGPITAGVLRGEKSRFQLFDDTVNTAARMESSGIKNKIQMTKSIYDLLVAAGKTTWVRPRETTIFVKGKGNMQTYWLLFGTGSGVSFNTHSDLGEAHDGQDMFPKHEAQAVLQSGDSAILSKEDSNSQRLILWNVKNMLVPLKKIVAARPVDAPEPDSDIWRELEIHSEEGATVLDEVKEIISLPNNPAANGSDVDTVVIEAQVIQQLIH
jgi:class 3 adenylate cyclase